MAAHFIGCVQAFLRDQNALLRPISSMFATSTEPWAGPAFDACLLAPGYAPGIMR
jgi:hypothetical protein